MADDDDYDFSGVSQRAPFDVESSLLSQWRAQNDDEEDDDYSYFCKHVCTPGYRKFSCMMHMVVAESHG